MSLSCAFHYIFSGFVSNEQILFEDGGVLIEDDDVFTTPVRLSFQQHARPKVAERRKYLQFLLCYYISTLRVRMHLELYVLC